jgi:hypothetical protein
MKMQTQREESFIHVNENGDMFYYKDKDMKILHRLDGPAIEYATSGKIYSGFKSWWVNGKQHRLEGPAVERADFYKAWLVNGKRHRLDGPAIEFSSGSKEWYVNDKRLTEEEFIALTAPKQPVELTLDQIAAKFGISVEILKVVK